MSPTLLDGILVAAFSVILGAVLKSLSSMSDRLRAIELQLARLDTQVGPLWSRANQSHTPR
jgi:hypothetical protein